MSNNISVEEQQIREQLAACYRIFDYLGWGELIYNHITAKIPGGEEHFLINPYGLSYSEVTASNLIKIDIEGNVIGESEWKVNPAGYIIHSAIHAARSDVMCIAHTHTTAGSVVACQEGGLRHDNFYSVLLYNCVAYHDFEGLTVRPEEQERLVADMGEKELVILRNHGLLTCGGSIPTAFFNMWMLQRSCEIQVQADASGRTLLPIADEIGEKSAELMRVQNEGQQTGELEFNALVRAIDRIDDSYKN